MGYRWHNGRFLSDEEYYNETGFDLDAVGIVFGFLIPFIGLGVLGYELGSKWLMLAGLALGGWIGYALNKILAFIIKWTLIIGIVGGIIALLVYIFISI